jgi:hypothetical protein
MNQRKQHHWSGWPGAVCLHCFKDDPLESAIGRGLYDPFTEKWLDNDESREMQKEVNEECPVGYNKNCGQCEKRL